MPVDVNGIRVHKHIVLTAAVNSPPKTEAEVISWLSDMVKAVDMNILDGPYASTSDVVNNEGITGVVIIDTSHIALHLWNNVTPAIIELDIFSCKDYDVSIPIDFLNKFDINAINFRCIDRTNAFDDIELFVVYEEYRDNKRIVDIHRCINFNQNQLNGKVLSVFTSESAALEYCFKQ